MKEDRDEYIKREYKGECDVLPRPTIVDNLSDQVQISKCLESGLRSALQYMQTQVVPMLKSQGKKLKSSPNALVFCFPLDFYIPLPDGYNSTIIGGIVGDIAKDLTCVTTVQDFVRVNNGAMRVSWLIVTLSDNRANKVFNDPENKEYLFAFYQKAIQACNSVIGGFMALPARHNHYMHFLTRQNVPMNVYAKLIDWKNGTTIHEQYISFHKNPYSEMENSLPLTEEELDQFRVLQVGNFVTGDSVYELVCKFNQAINARCFAHDDDAILLAANFVEHSIGYIFCELKIALGNDSQAVFDEYAAFKKMSEIWEGFKGVFDGMSVKEIKKRIGFGEWFIYCQQLRDNLVHRFLTNKPTGADSQKAVLYSGRIVYNLCDLALEKCDDEALRRKLNILKSASFISEQIMG